MAENRRSPGHIKEASPSGSVRMSSGKKEQSEKGSLVSCWKNNNHRPAVLNRASEGLQWEVERRASVFTEYKGRHTHISQPVRNQDSHIFLVMVFSRDVFLTYARLERSSEDGPQRVRRPWWRKHEPGNSGERCVSGRNMRGMILFGVEPINTFTVSAGPVGQSQLLSNCQLPGSGSWQWNGELSKHIRGERPD